MHWQLKSPGKTLDSMTSHNDQRPPEHTDYVEDRLWPLAKSSGLSRRRFLQLLSVGGAAAVLAACGSLGLTRSTDATPSAVDITDRDEFPGWFKDPAPFIRRSASLEARLENMQGVITPNRFFFVRNNSSSIDVGADTWRLSVEGDAVAMPMNISYREIRAMPSRTLVSYLECAGNHRAMFSLVNGQEAQGTQWERGAIGNGEWTGVPLRDVLERAGIRGDAASVLMVGLDKNSPEEGFRRVMPVDKAMHPDTILAYALNGETLPRDHGFPLRVVTPGWVGSSWIKWLGRIVVSSERQWTRNNTTSYVLIGDDYQSEGEAEGQVVTTQSIKSALALPWPADISAGLHLIHGYAHSPHGVVSRVEWSADSGASWHMANVQESQARYSWVRFEFIWDASPGEYTLMTRAIDSEGNTQPDNVPFNAKGYLFNQPLPHPVRVG